MSMIDRWFAIVGLLLIGVFLSNLAIADDGVNRSYQIIDGKTDGKTLNLAQVIGKKPVYLKFWATWCQPCREQMPHFVKANKKFADSVTFIAVNIDVNDDVKAVKAMMAEFGMQMPVIVDERGLLTQKYKIVGTPTHILLNAQGQVVHKGHKTNQKLDDGLAKLANSTSVATMPVVELKSKITPQRPLVIRDKGFTSVFFTATWCDWYLAETRPQVSENCINGQKLINKLSRQYPKMNLVGVLSPLWTSLKELKQYQRKYRIIYRQIIDIASAAAVKYQVKDNPTLVIFKDGKEILRMTDFSDEQQINSKLNALF